MEELQATRIADSDRRLGQVGTVGSAIARRGQTGRSRLAACSPLLGRRRRAGPAAYTLVAAGRLSSCRPRPRSTPAAFTAAAALAAQVLHTVTGSLRVARERDRLLRERRSNVVAAFRKAGLPGIGGQRHPLATAAQSEDSELKSRCYVHLASTESADSRVTCRPSRTRLRTPAGTEGLGGPTTGPGRRVAMAAASAAALLEPLATPGRRCHCLSA